jgi:hypothetical protein
MKQSLVLLSLVMFFAVSCKKDTQETNDNDPTKTASSFSLEFNAIFDGQPLDFNNMKWVTKSQDTLNFIRLRMLLSKITLIKEDNTEVELDTFAFISFDGNRTVLVFNETPPSGTYKGMRFQIGIDSVENHGDPAQWPNGHPLDPLVNHMHWTWQTGYIFWVAEGYFMNKGNEMDIFSFHMANLNYRKQVTMMRSSPFVIQAGKSTNLQVQMHMEKYFSDPALYSLKVDGPISHSASVGDIRRMDVLHGNMGSMFELK